MKTWLWIPLALSCCASEPPCDFDKHIYVYETEPVSGTCGKLDLSELPAGDCVQRDLPVTGTCARGKQTLCGTAEMTTEWISILHREDDDTSYSGTVSVTIANAQHVVTCKATYSVKLTQQ